MNLVPNFRVRGKSEGSRHDSTFGPRDVREGLDFEVWQRHKGEALRALQGRSRVVDGGTVHTPITTLVTRIEINPAIRNTVIVERDPSGRPIALIITTER